MKILVIFCFIFSILGSIQGKSVGNSANSMQISSGARQNFTTETQTENSSTLQINNEALTAKAENGAKITGGLATQVQGSLITEEPINIRLKPCCKGWNPDAITGIVIRLPLI